MLSVEKMQNVVIDKVAKYEDTINISITSNREDIKVQTSKYKLEVIINSKWLGYDFSLNESLTNNIPVGSSLDTDLYPLDFDEEVTEDIFKEILEFLDDLFGNSLFYGLRAKDAILARPDHKSKDGGYEIIVFPSGILGKGILTTIKKERWSQEAVKADHNLVRLMATE